MAHARDTCITLSNINVRLNSKLTVNIITCYLHINFNLNIAVTQIILFILYLYIILIQNRTNLRNTVVLGLAAVKRVCECGALALASGREWHLSACITDTHKHLH